MSLLLASYIITQVLRIKVSLICPKCRICLRHSYKGSTSVLYSFSYTHDQGVYIDETEKGLSLEMRSVLIQVTEANVHVAPVHAPVA